MPELPEVETVVRSLNQAGLVGKRIVRTEAVLKKLFVPAALPRLLVNQTVKKIFRRAKFIVFTLSDFSLAVHLRMTGHLFLSPLKNLKSTSIFGSLLMTAGF
ncbi:MAG: DNA-formamidopyrimidine glycosylase family protein [Parachlamydiales bacterium]|jgi:formamidopyrimidine-DNA glycosylase